MTMEASSTNGGNEAAKVFTGFTNKKNSFTGMATDVPRLPLEQLVSPRDPTLELDESPDSDSTPSPSPLITSGTSSSAAAPIVGKRGSAKWLGAKKLVSAETTLLASPADTVKEADRKLVYGNWIGEERTRSKWIISPDGSFRTRWDLSQLLVLSYVALLVPVRVCFNVETEGPAFIIDLLVDSYFWIDIVVNFFSASKIETGLEVTFVDDFRSIARAYIKGWLTLDILACLPLDYISRISERRLGCSFTKCEQLDSDARSGSNGGALKLLKLLRAFRLLKLVRLTRFKRILARYEDQLVYWQQVLVIVKVFGVVMLFSHWAGCFYGAVYDFDPELTLLQKWTSCFYWAVQTTTTVGYGDRTSDTVVGQLVSVVGMTVGGVVFSWFLSNIFTLINPDPSYQQRQETMQYVVTYLRSNRFPIETAARVLSYFRKSSQFTFDEQKLLAQLPIMLRTEIFDFMYTSSIRAAPVFKDQEENFVSDLALSVTPVTFEDNEMIYQEGDVGESMYILVSGRISIFSDLNRKSILKGMLVNSEKANAKVVSSFSEAGSYFGEEAVLGIRKRVDYACAKEQCKLLSVPAPALENLFEVFPSAREDMIRMYVGKMATFEEKFDKELILKVMTDLNVVNILDDTGCIRKNYRAVLRDQQSATKSQNKRDFISQLTKAQAETSNTQIEKMSEQIDKLQTQMEEMKKEHGKQLEQILQALHGAGALVKSEASEVLS
mmetsp:Transcript_11963/g.14238  ORF Transcript_11963/g.14238 Transcript_11963/m.14238 type:complete len:723 (-) Transcript_11963:612-2780(-)